MFHWLSGDWAMMRFAASLSLALAFGSPLFAEEIEVIAQDPEMFRLPSVQAVQAIKGIGVIKAPANPSFWGIDIDKNTLTPESPVNSAPDGTKVPFWSKDALLLQLDPDITAEELNALIDDKGLAVIKTYPELGAIQVQTDLSKFVQPGFDDNSNNDTISNGVLSAMKHFNDDPRIVNAIPDTLLSDQTYDNVMSPTDVTLSIERTAGEQADWGVASIEANQAWSLDGATDGVMFGVLDDGFARHDDLVFMGFRSDNADNSHGNHVAGIACARHNNAVGVKGVLPNCFIRAKKEDFIFNATEGGNIVKFVSSFSDIVSALDSFVRDENGISTFNVSLGYNWRPNFGIDIDSPQNAQWRTWVESQGRFMAQILQFAQQRDKAIFSAAGNDSADLAAAGSAKFASPFNWAALTLRDLGLSRAGVVVEAHDPQGKRAAFSNSGGHIACPGTNILSAVAFDANKVPSRSAYGRMSGTSMASPYCAAGHQLFMLVRPGYGAIEAIDCLLTSSAKTDVGTPMLKLTQALAACPPK